LIILLLFLVELELIVLLNLILLKLIL